MRKDLLPIRIPDDKELDKFINKGFTIVKWYSIFAIVSAILGLSVVGLIVYILIRFAISLS